MKNSISQSYENERSVIQSNKELTEKYVLSQGMFAIDHKKGIGQTSTSQNPYVTKES